jgi:hypothetical protein
MANTGVIANVMFESAKDTYESQNQLLPLCTFNEPDPAKQQNSGNVTWYPVQQHAPIIDGWDLTGEETDIIEETYPVILGVPTNDFISQRADDRRDNRFWERRGEQSGRRQASNLNQKIAEAIRTQGSLFYRSSTASGYDFIAEAQALMNERQSYTTERNFVLNDRDTLKFSKDLASRETIKGRPADTWLSGQIGSNVAEFDVFTGSYLPNITGGADPATTVTGDQSFAPEGGSADSATGIVTNVDYRSATIVVAASASYAVGDKVTFSNGGSPVEALGLDDKTETGEAMTFTIVAKPSGTSITVYPKPIAADDPALSKLEKAYANIDTQILNGATVDRLNTDASKKSNLFWDKSAIEVTGGTIPAELFAQYDGMKVITDTMSNGLQLYMIYDGDIATMTFRYRIFTWWGITVCNPANAGVAVTFSA